LECLRRHALHERVDAGNALEETFLAQALFLGERDRSSRARAVERVARYIECSGCIGRRDLGEIDSFCSENLEESPDVYDVLPRVALTPCERLQGKCACLVGKEERERPPIPRRQRQLDIHCHRSARKRKRQPRYLDRGELLADHPVPARTTRVGGHQDVHDRERASAPSISRTLRRNRLPLTLV
jgi:hypothetical protein